MVYFCLSTDTFFNVCVIKIQHKGIKMFKATILVCLLSQDCIELVDNRGPYDAEEACKARVSEMFKDFMSTPGVPPVVVFDFKCEKLEGLDI